MIRICALLAFPAMLLGQHIDLTGSWTFNSASAVYGVSSTATGQITQTGTSLSGQFAITGTPCATTATVSGTVVGTTVHITLTEGNQPLTLIGTVASDGSSGDGTYTSPAGGCAGGDRGSWSGTRAGIPGGPAIKGTVNAA